MNRRIFYFAFMLFLMFSVHNIWAFCSSSPDVYLVLYATVNGKTGHVGLAMDNYLVEVKEKIVNGEKQRQYDTVKAGNLTYYDLWPEEDGSFGLIKAIRNIPPRYYKLPTASWESEITVFSLMDKGIPHEEGYPCDGLIRIKTLPLLDYQLYHYMDKLMEASRPFNAWLFNCADFVESGLEYLTGKIIYADEYILLGFSTTPNKLFQQAMLLPDTKIIKHPGNIIYSSFTMERIWNKVIR